MSLSLYPAHKDRGVEWLGKGTGELAGNFPGQEGVARITHSPLT